MTKKLYTAVAAGTALVAVTMGASSANAATATATARANIVAALTFTNVSNLEYGTIVPGAAAADVTVNPASGRVCGAGLTCSGTPAAASFTINGTAGETVSIAPVVATTTLTSGANSMTMDTVTVSAASATLNGSGQAVFTAGGTLHVGASQAAGVYTGNFNVNVNYN
jgi:hypothetical protein